MQAGMIDIFMYLALTLAFVLVFVKLFFAGSLIKTYNENREKRFLIPVALLFITFAIARSILIYFDFYLTAFNDDLFQTYSLVWKIAMTFQNIGFIFLLFVAEKEIFKDKTMYIITIFSGVFLILITFIPDIVLYQTLLNISLSITPLIIPISYIYLAWVTTGEPRKKAIYIFVGYFIYMVGMLMLAEIFQDGAVAIFGINKYIVRYILYSISMVTRISGLIFLYYGFSKD